MIVHEYTCIYSSLFQQLGYTPLTMACEKGYLEVVQKLVEAKADVNLCDEVSDVIPCLYNYCSRMQLQCRFALQLHEVYIIIICTSTRVYFRISLKSGQMHCGKFQEGAKAPPHPSEK